MAFALLAGGCMLTNPAGTNDLTSAIIGAAIRVHQDKGPGLLESVYVECLVLEIRHCGMTVRRRVPVPLIYRGCRLESSYQLDLLVDDTVIVEVKAAAALAPIHSAQLLTYMKLTGLPVGLLINFNVTVLKEGVRRLVNPRPAGRRPSASNGVVEAATINHAAQSAAPPVDCD